MASIPLYYQTGNLHEMGSAELEYPAYQILAAFAANNTHTGTINIGGTGTSIGTFEDTKRPNTIGTHPVGTTVNSTTTTFNQNLTAAAETLTRPLEYDGGNLHEQADGDLNAQIINKALTVLVNDGLGSYKIQPTAPTGGTWTNLGTITDTAQSGDTTTTLWRKTSETAPTTFRPLKVRTDANIQEFTDAEIQTLLARFQNRILATGVGKYSVQNAAPTSGTWVRKGNAWTDTRQQVSNVGYTGTYSGTYSGSYAGFIPIYYAGTYYGSYTAYYTGYYTGFYSGTYTGLTVQGTKETPSTVSLWIRTA